ncbi:MAG: hypothetical protein R2827_16300 [Bdellovibrionales bacterium]
MTGIDVGLDLPMIRAWIGYNFTNTYSFDNPLFGDDYDGGGAMSLGLSLGFIPFIEINAEYMTSSDGGSDVDFLLLSAELSN